MSMRNRNKVGKKKKNSTWFCVTKIGIKFGKFK